MEEPISVTTALYELRGEIKVVFNQLQNLSSDISTLKTQSEDRRNSMDSLAKAIRSEIKCSEDATTKQIIEINTNYTELKTQFNFGKWVVAALATTVIALVGNKFWTVVTTDFSNFEHHDQQSKV